MYTPRPMPPQALYPISAETGGEGAEKGPWLCQRCGNCCRWPGFVRLRHDEVDRIAGALRLPVAEFVERFTDLHADRTALVLKNQADGACIFLEGRNVCRIQEAKPFQCRGFPNTWNFPGWREVCEALPAAPGDPLTS